MDKLIAVRMKKRGMSRTKRGADRMARLISLKETGKLNTWIKRRIEPQHAPAKERTMPEESQYRGKDDGAWLQARLPGLYGSHCNRHWAQVLRTLAHADTDMRD